MGPWEADVVLADGGSAHLRPVRPEDRDALRQLYESLSESSRYLRFFSSVSPTVAGTIGPRVDNDDEHFGLVVESGDELVAVADYFCKHGDIAEVAFAVRDDQQRRGLGTLLLDHLAEIAVAHGVRCFVAQVLDRNTSMRGVFRDAGFAVRSSRRDLGIVEVVLDLTRTDHWREAYAGREQSAEGRSIARLVTPSSVAVVGASRRRDAIGNAVLRNLVGGGFTGEVYAVNPNAEQVEGMDAYPSVSAISGPVDLAVVTVPAAVVDDVVRDCARKGVHGLVVISSGFAEVGAAEAQAALRTFARGHGMRVVGPNCVGIVNTNQGVQLNATFAPVAPRRGVVGFGSDSGGIGIELLARAGASDLGVSTFVSLGNKTDVSGNDLLQYWDQDDDTRVILLYLESFGNPRKFARLARRIARTKPIVALKSGRTPAGARGAASHTAALTNPDVAVDELFRQAGVVRVDTLEDLFAVATLFAHQPIPDGRRVGIVTNGGGPGILAADACVAAGLEVPELSTGLQAQLREVAPPGAGLRNPVDLVASAGADVYDAALRLLAGSGEVDALLVIYVSPLVSRPEDIERAVVQATQATDTIPVAACFLGAEVSPGPLRGQPGDRTIPTFGFPESAARALARAAHLGEWRRAPMSEVPTLDRVDEAAGREVVRRWLADSPDGGWVDAVAAAKLLDAFGIPTLPTRRVDSAESAAEAADEVGYPVALKVADPAIVHKTEAGGVRLGLASAPRVRDAYAAMAGALGDRMGGALVQPMADPGVELIVGVTQDARFGPLVLFGMGGVTAELIRDTALRLVPLTALDAHDMVRALRTSPMLFGYRNAPPVDVTGVEDLLLRVGRLAEIPELAELDCNPVRASGHGVCVLDVKLRLAPRVTADAYTLDR